MSTHEVPDGQPFLIDGPEVPEPAARPMDHKQQPKQAKKGKVPARQSNGYYADHVTGDRLRSVTTILSGGVPKEGLVPWAGFACTDAAIEALPQLVAASRNPERLAELRSWIGRAHTRKKDERAEIGSLVHAVIESRILGTELPQVIRQGETEWRTDGPELAPFLEQLLAFEERWQPRWTASEMVVANPVHGYAGTLDYLIGAEGLIGDALRDQGWSVDPAGMLMGDTKTGGEWDRTTSAGHVHGVYPEAGLQMAAYRQARVAWLRDGARVDMPATAEVGIVLHLRPEGFRLYPVRCGDREYAYFRHAQMVDEWSSRMSSAKAAQPVIGAPLALPRTRTAVA